MNIWVKAVLLTLGEIVGVIVFLAVFVGLIVGAVWFVYLYPYFGVAAVVIACFIPAVVSKKRELE